MVLMQELLATDQCNFDMMKKFWHPSTRIYYSAKTPKHNMVINSWRDLYKWIKEEQEDCVPAANAHSQSDHSFKIKDNLAVVQYIEDNVREGRAILQWHEGRWKFIHKSIRESRKSDIASRK